jgi:hypothetical protein
MEKTYLGQIEKGLQCVKVFYNEKGFVLKFYFNDRIQAECELLDDDHVWRELKARGFKKSFRKVILSML